MKKLNCEHVRNHKFLHFPLLLILLFALLFTLGACDSHEHTGGERCMQKAICQICGEEYGEPAGHVFEYVRDKDGHTKKCTREGCVEPESRAAHSGGVSTCTSVGTCTVCGYEYLPKREHNVVGATCAKLGTCTTCGEEAGELLAHKYKGATCTKAGTCTVCGSEGGDLAAHQYQGATCAKLGVCSACGAEGGEFSDEHVLPDDADACTLCGLDYYSVTLKFTLNATKDGYIVSGLGSCTRTVITVPDTYKGLPVTEIGSSALSRWSDEKCNEIVEVQLPASVVKIGDNAFNGNEKLKSVTMPGVQEIGDSAFAECLLLNNVHFQDSLLKIGQNAFFCCTSLQEIIISPSITEIGGAAFMGCSNLKKLELHDGITQLGECMVMECKALEYLYIPKLIVEIPQSFAEGCTSLKTVETGGNLKSIGTQAFYKCTSLQSFDFGNALEIIAPRAFTECTSLTVVELPDTVKTIDTNAFLGCTSLRQLIIPSTVETIGIKITQKCDTLEYNIYKGMQYLGDSKNPYLLFMGKADSSEKDIIIHEDTRFVWPNMTFAELEAESIYWGKSVESYWFDSFKGANALEKIEVSAENKKYHSQGNCLIETATKTLLHGCKSSIIPGDGTVTVIGRAAFYSLETLTHLIIPSTVKTIEVNAFAYCTGLEWLVIGNGVKVIKDEILINANASVVIYYMGSADEWEEIAIAGYNATGIGRNYELVNARRYYYSETQPTGEGNFWHYVDGKPKPW